MSTPSDAFAKVAEINPEHLEALRITAKNLKEAQRVHSTTLELVSSLIFRDLEESLNPDSKYKLTLDLERGLCLFTVITE
jgi:hypothetical protein